MDYDTFGTALDSVLILAAALLCGLHLWFSAVPPRGADTAPPQPYRR